MYRVQEENPLCESRNRETFGYEVEPTLEKRIFALEQIKHTLILFDFNIGVSFLAAFEHD